MTHFLAKQSLVLKTSIELSPAKSILTEHLSEIIQESMLIILGFHGTRILTTHSLKALSYSKGILTIRFSTQFLKVTLFGTYSVFKIRHLNAPRKYISKASDYVQVGL